MSFKINLNTNINTGASAPTPSQSYYNTTTRFQSILSSKLGVNASSTTSASSDGLGQTLIDFQDLTKVSGATASEIDRALAGTEMEGLGASFVEAEEKYGVNAWFLTGLAAHESNFGTSSIAQAKNNLFGFQAYDSSPYQSAKSFDSFEEGIDSVAAYLKENYLSSSGKYFNGLGISDVNQKYATDENWANAITNHINTMIGV